MASAPNMDNTGAEKMQPPPYSGPYPGAENPQAAGVPYQAAPLNPNPGYPQPPPAQGPGGYPQPPPAQGPGSYPPPQGGYPGAPSIQIYQQQQNQQQQYGGPNQVTYVTTTTNNSSFSGMKAAIPVMPMWCAVTLCVVNCLFPGLGTIIASFTVFCCANVGQQTSSSCGIFCLNFWVGWLQMITLFVFLIGWVWSIMWGVLFIGLATEYGKPPAETVTTMTTVPISHVQVPNIVHQPPGVYPAAGYGTAEQQPK
uniref:Protein SPEC3-like n=1 Tax=Ciona intestinalis TaxID=7719 RepID=F6R1S7_CIOIN|nr:protein SPEC3-like [Ciona intestinalis]|eukprot:XP_002121910.1 protein SPEC3-like [Ciona intestinalis]